MKNRYDHCVKKGRGNLETLSEPLVTIATESKSHQISSSSLGRSWRDQRALSLIFSIVLTTVMLLTAAGMSGSFLRAAERNNSLFRSIQAYYAARASMEEAIANADQHGVGFEYELESAVSWDQDADGDVEVEGDYEYHSQAKPLNWQSENPAQCGFGGVNCYIPMPGSGTASTNCDFTDGTQQWASNADDECNWNRLSLGQNVSIPFFYSNELGEVKNPSETGLYLFQLKIRTPMKPDGSGRYQLDTSDGDDVVVSWQFTAQCDEDGDGVGETDCYLGPLVETETSGGGPFGGSSIYEESLIEETEINSALSTGFILLDGQDYGKNRDAENQEIGDFMRKVTTKTPSLNLSIINGLIDIATGNEIPYLEYQVIVDKPISDHKILYESLGIAKGRRGTYTYPLTATQQLGSEPVIHFAVQN